MAAARLVIYPPDDNGWRRVRWDGTENPEDFDLGDPALVDWRGAGPESWAEPPP